MTEERELEVWRKEWETLGGREDLARMLTERVAKDGRRIKLGIAGEVLAAIFSSTVSLWIAIGTHGKPIATVLCAGIFLFNGIWLTRLWTLREGAGLGDGLDGFIALTRRRLADNLRWNGFAHRAALAVGVASAAWSAWALSAGWAFYRAEPWRGVLGFGGIVVILAWVFAWLRSKRAKIAAERERFESLVTSSLVDD